MAKAKGKPKQAAAVGAPTVEQLLAANSAALLRNMTQGEQPTNDPAGVCVYLPVNTNNLVQVRAQLERELERRQKAKEKKTAAAAAAPPAVPLMQRD